MKKVTIGIIIGLLLGSVGIYAAYKYNAKDVSYNNTNVESAINDIYTTIGNNSVKAITICNPTTSAGENTSNILIVSESGNYYSANDKYYNEVANIVNSNSDIITVSSINSNALLTATVKKAGYYIVKNQIGSFNLNPVHYDIGDTIFNNVQYGGLVIYLGKTNPFSE